MDGTWVRQQPDGSGRDRANLGRAFALFKAAGYELKGTQLTHIRTGRPFSFEILTTTRDQERLALAFARNLNKVASRRARPSTPPNSSAVGSRSISI